MRRLLSLICLLLWASCAEGAVAFDAHTSSAGGTGDYTYDHVPVGTVRGVIVHVIVNGLAVGISGVTADGAALTEVAESPVTNATGELGSCHTFFLGSSIPAGTLTIAVDATLGTEVSVSGCTTLTADQDTSVVDTGIVLSDGASNPSVTLSLGSVSSFVMIGAWSGLGNLSMAPNTGWTERFEHDYGNQNALIYTYDTVGTTDVAAGYTAGSDDVAMHAIAVRENAGGAAATAPQIIRLLDDLLCPTAYAEEVVYRMSRETHDRLLGEGLSWWHWLGQNPPADATEENKEDWLLMKSSFSRCPNGLKGEGITKEVIP